MRLSQHINDQIDHLNYLEIPVESTGYRSHYSCKILINESAPPTKRN